MRGAKTLDEVSVVTRAKTNFVSRLSTVNAQTITSGELQKAACCNLSESFETSASVDVSYSDAVTGAKQIELLGLSGIYSQMMSENIPQPAWFSYFIWFGICAGKLDGIHSGFQRRFIRAQWL